jgi:hypothetical protein
MQTIDIETLYENNEIGNSDSNLLSNIKNSLYTKSKKKN